MDFKSKMQNVSFGGDWSEALIEEGARREVLYALEAALENCLDQPIDEQQIMPALSYLKCHIDKGGRLATEFVKALSIMHPLIRVQETTRILEVIKKRL